MDRVSKREPTDSSVISWIWKWVMGAIYSYGIQYEYAWLVVLTNLLKVQVLLLFKYQVKGWHYHYDVRYCSIFIQRHSTQTGRGGGRATGRATRTHTERGRTGGPTEQNATAQSHRPQHDPNTGQNRSQSTPGSGQKQPGDPSTSRDHTRPRDRPSIPLVPRYRKWYCTYPGYTGTQSIIIRVPLYLIISHIQTK